jgi:peptidoglycan/LPS O-acetylase OafA/YrhL
VISGYLITRLIHEEMNAGSFSVLRFYERRVRRIMPALLLVVAFCCAAASVLFLPDDLSRFSRSAIAALLFFSNFYFARSSGYFDGASHEKPLLHTWSLAIEEQFYIVFPILLAVLMTRWPHRLKIAIWAAAAASLTVGTVMTYHRPETAFFFSFARAWELMLGSLLAIGAVPAVTHRSMREVLAIAGLAMIAIAVATYSPITPFPGYAALLPCLGAALLIHTGNDAPTLASRFLAARPVVFIGLISYSLYLWHWPLIVFAKYISPDRSAVVAAAIASFVLAVLSWRWVEQPFRKAGTLDRRRIFSLAAAASAALIAFCGFVQASKGWPSRLPESVFAVLDSKALISPARDKCHASPARWISFDAACRFGADRPPSIAVFGDSHGVELAQALGDVALEHSQSALQLTYSGCPPVMGLASTIEISRCDEFNRLALSSLSKSASIKTVVLVGRHYFHLFGAPNGRGDTYRIAFRDPNARATDPAGIADLYWAGLAKTIEELHQAGKEVVLLLTYPEIGRNAPRAVATDLMRRGGSRGATISLEEDRSRQSTVLEGLGRIGVGNAAVVDPRLILCDRNQCPFYRDGKVLYYDDNHVSLPGARLVAEQIWAVSRLSRANRGTSPSN